MEQTAFPLNKPYLIFLEKLTVNNYIIPEIQAFSVPDLSSTQTNQTNLFTILESSKM